MFSMRTNAKRIFLYSFSFILMSSCTTAHRIASPSQPVTAIEIGQDPQIGCLDLAENFCNSLYSKNSLGNIEVIRPGGNISILQGETINDFNQQFYSYSRAKINGREKLPNTFNRILTEYSYFKKLQSLLTRSSRKQMTLQERIHFERLDKELESIWSMAFEETLLRRMVARFPSYHRIGQREMPPEYEIEYKKERRRLNNQISTALWSGNKNWAHVKETFKQLQYSFYRVIDRLDVDNSLKDDFKERIRTVQLALPGSRPEIEDNGCSSTTVNAFYYKYLNIITVCAGDFNTEDILQTLAHEMSHALDFSRSLYNFENRSELAVFQKNLRRQICTDKKIDCANWSLYKNDLQRLLQSLTNFNPPLKQFNQCLQLSRPGNIPTETDYARIAKSDTMSIFSSLADNDYFLRITKDKLPLRNGKNIKNPYYLNPCKYYHWSNDEEPPEDEINSLVYFTAEYMCSEKTSNEKFQSALEVSQSITEAVTIATLKASGEFSSDSTMMAEGFSSPSNERFADVFGSYAIKDYLSMFPSISDRRGKFLASISWLCTEPSLAAKFPEETLVQNKYLSSEHTSGTVRLKEIIGEPIQASLNCRKDFVEPECKLPLSGL